MKDVVELGGARALASVGKRRMKASKRGVTVATVVCWSMTSLTSTP